MKLGELFNKYGSDKDRNGYTPVYESLFKHWRPTSLLEVGIGTMLPGVPSSMVGYALPGYRPGGSLRAWRDYLPEAEIVGVDVQPDTQFQEERIRTLLCDSTDAKAVQRTLSERTVDVIIDDGLHTHDAQIATLRNLMQHVRPGGFYIVEDVYPGSPFGPFVRDVLTQLSWFATEKQNLFVFSL